MTYVVVLLSWLLIVPIATAQVVLSASFQTTASATTGPGNCVESDGGVGVGEAIAFCSDPKGNTAAASSRANLTASTTGGMVFAHAEAAANATGIPPFEQPNGNASGTSGISWSLQSTTFHFSRSLSSAGGAFVNFSSGTSGPLPPSGILPPDVYSLNGSVSAIATARDVDGPETVTAIPQRVEARVSFAVVGSTTLIMGFVRTDGVGRSGLLVEALDAGVSILAAPAPVSSTLTGDDGSYLLPAIVGPVTLRISDPEGGFVTQESSLLLPPATIDFDLVPVLSLPALQAPLVAFLCALIALAGSWQLRLRIAR